MPCKVYEGTWKGLISGREYEYSYSFSPYVGPVRILVSVAFYIVGELLWTLIALPIKCIFFPMSLVSNVRSVRVEKGPKRLKRKHTDGI